MTSLETVRSLANGPIVAGGWGGIPRELQRLLSLIGYGCTGGVCGRSNGGGNSLHWKANMLPLFSIMILCTLDSVGDGCAPVSALLASCNIYERKWRHQNRRHDVSDVIYMNATTWLHVHTQLHSYYDCIGRILPYYSYPVKGIGQDY